MRRRDAGEVREEEEEEEEANGEGADEREQGGWRGAGRRKRNRPCALCIFIRIAKRRVGETASLAHANRQLGYTVYSVAAATPL